jgi:CHASE3 domain sensor protein
MPGWDAEAKYNELARDVSSLEGSVAQGTHRLDQIEKTLDGMASAEMAELRKRADLPRRLLYAVAVPVLVGVLTALILIFLGSIHVGS